MVAAAHAEPVLGVVAEAVADVGDNRGSGCSVDDDSSGNIGISGSNGRRWRQQRMAMDTTANTGSVVAAAATVAMAAVDNNRSCGGRQQSTKCGSGGGSGGRRDSGSAAEVTTMRAKATATTVVVNLYTFFPLAMVR